MGTSRFESSFLRSGRDRSQCGRPRAANRVARSLASARLCVYPLARCCTTRANPSRRSKHLYTGDSRIL
ncbi:hypothetical protein GQ600_10810 [Phytophthora cactorum]|nr:hypothetical protein GQ600_10810 [Phytophthora cactorum]